MKKRLKKGLESLGISTVNDKILEQEVLFVEELLRWNKKINLTAITAADDVIEKHLLDSLALMPMLQNKKTILDIGSGAGLPVIPLAIAMPEEHFISIDSVGKKTNFQQHVKRLLGLTNLEIMCARIENICLREAGWEGVDVVVARAVGRLDFLLKVALPILKPGGTMIAMKGPEGEGELQELDRQWQKVYHLPHHATSYQLPFSGAQRSLIEIIKIPLHNS